MLWLAFFSYDSEPCLHWSLLDWVPHLLSFFTKMTLSLRMILSHVSALKCLPSIRRGCFHNKREQFTAKHTSVPRYLWHFTGNWIRGHHCLISTQNLKRVQDSIDYYINQICPNTVFKPASIHQTLHCLLPAFLIPTPLSFFFPVRQWQWIIEQSCSPNVRAGKIVCSGW